MPDSERINSIYREIGKRVTQARKNLGLTQDKLSIEVGTSRASIALIERGNQRPPIDRLYRIANVLHCEIYDLLPPITDFFPKKEKGDIQFDSSIEGLSKKELRAVTAVILKDSK